MRDKVLKKADGKLKKDGKNNTKNSESEEDGFLRDRNGDLSCCIPMVPCNKKGQPMPESLEDGGVKLCCTNNCVYSKHFVHPECFESLEQGLITMLSNQKTGKKGLIKAWLESQNEVNLWSKRGLEFIQKTIRCPCGKGQMFRDEDAWIKRQQIFDPLCDKKDKKFKLKQNLPALTLAVKPGAAPPPGFHQLDTHYMSSHSPPPEKIDIDDKYGPFQETKARKPSVNDDKVTTKSPVVKKISIEFSSIKPSTATSKPIEKPINKKVPIGYAPVEPKEDFPALVEVTPKQAAPVVDQKARSHTPHRETPPPKSITVESKPMGHTVAAAVMPKTTTLEPKIQNLITMNEMVQPKIQNFLNHIEQFQNNEARSATPEHSIKSPTNTTTSNSSSQNTFSPRRLVSVAVQTDVTCFPLEHNRVIPGLYRLDSINYYDSGNHSSSPSIADSYRQPLSFNNDYYANDHSNNYQPRGFDYYAPDSRKSSDRFSTSYGNEYSKAVEEEELSPKITFLFKNRSFAVEIDYQNGTKEKLKNSNGFIWTPMYLSMTEGGPHFGEKAQNDYEDFPQFVIYDILKIIGKPWNELQRNPKWGFKLSHTNGTICFETETATGRRGFPQELILAMFLKMMKLQADSHLGTEIKNIYIATDSFLTKSQQIIFEEAAKKLKSDVEGFALIDTP